MKNLSFVLALSFFSSTALAHPMMCNEKGNTSSNNGTNYLVEVNNEWNFARVIVNNNYAQFGTLNCLRSENSNILNCHSKNAADVGFSANFYRNSEGKIISQLYAVTITGSHLIANLECTRHTR